jgi:hypothetical protein
MRQLAYALVAAAVMALCSVIPEQPCSAQESLPIGAKGIYLWQLWTANGGGHNLDAVIAKAHSVGIGWIVIKMGDGDSYYNSPNHSLYNWVVPNYGSMDSVVALLHSNGIKLLAFQYVYGVPHHWSNAVSETDVANMILDVKGIDGLIIDAEIQYDTLTNRVAAARAYCDSIRAHHPGSFVGLTAWARINGHATFPWVTFLDRVDVNMPQTYWAARPTTPQNELGLMSSQFTSYTNTWVSQGDSAAAKPIMPIGQGEYFGYSNDVMQGDITTFCTLCQTTYNYPGISLWEYNQIAHTYVWDEYTAAWQPTSVSTAEHAPIQYSLSQNYPNPFNPNTTIGFRVAGGEAGSWVSGEEKASGVSAVGSVVSGPGPSWVRLAVYDVLGREVVVLVNESKMPGTYEVRLDGTGLSSGMYLYRMTATSQSGDASQVFTQVKKLVLMK